MAAKRSVTMFRLTLISCMSVVALCGRSVSGVCATTFPVRSADIAIAVAQQVCLKYGGPLLDEDMNKTTIRNAMPSLRWNATLRNQHWHVDTLPSVVAGTNDHLLVVDIPIEGPAPKECVESGYDLVGVPPRPRKPRGPCKPTNISETDAQELALEAVAPHGGVWLEASRAKSEPDAWIVSVRIPERPPSDAGADKGLFKIFKRTANVLNLRTGVQFTSLPSKAQFVEHHCLYGR